MSPARRTEPQPEPISRRRWMSALLALAALPLVGVAERLGRWRSALSPRVRLSLPRPGSDGVHFEGEVILVRQGERLSAYSSRCPHLGCRVQRVEDGVMVCPCHGSRFDAAGRRLTGPASADLRALPIEPDPQPERVLVVLPG